MNFLAHLILSPPNELVQLGNFVADAVKGKYSASMPEAMIDGIKLHHSIDEYTDKHPVNREMRKLLNPDFRKYSGVVLDIYYDHFIAQHWNQNEVPLRDYARKIYEICIANFDLLPPKTKRILPYLISGNWLYNYANFKGLENVFNGMLGRANFASGMERSVEVLKRDYKIIEEAYFRFFPDLKEFVESREIYKKYME